MIGKNIFKKVKPWAKPYVLIDINRLVTKPSNSIKK
jgi:hypothetical protein